jgi:hypothetical protein
MKVPALRFAVLLVVGLLLPALHPVAARPTHSPTTSATQAATGVTYLPLVQRGSTVARDVQPVPDAARATTRTVTEEGATLSTTGSDGTRYTLVMPAGAIAGARDITMTPLAAAHGLPFSGGLRGGVALIPAGLEFFGPATLRIEPPAAINPAQIIALAAEDGADLHLYPATVTSWMIEMQLYHFSEYMGASATPGEAAAQAEKTPAKLRSQLEQAIAKERTCQIMGAGCDDTEDLGALVRQLLEAQWQQEIRPKLDAAQSAYNFSQVVEAVQAFLSWERTRQLMGVAELQQLADIGWQKLDGLFTRAVEIAFRECSQYHHFEYLTVLLGLERQAQLLGGPDGQALAKWHECLTFELDLRSTVEQNMSGDALRVTVATRVPLTIDGSSETFVWRGSAQPQLISYTWDLDGCTATFVPKDYVNTEITMRLRWDWRGHGHLGVTDKALVITGVEMEYFPGMITGTQLFTCDGETQPSDGAAWPHFLFILFHEDELGDAGIYHINGWVADRTGTSLVAYKLYDRSQPWGGDTTLSERTRFDLLHFP